MVAPSKSVLPRIESSYEKMTYLEKQVADFFLKNRQIVDFSAKGISARLTVSEATLSRFAQKCGFRGYREFIYLYEASLNQSEFYDTVTTSSKQVLHTYQSLLTKSFALIDEDQISRVAEMISLSEQTIVCGKGSSGFAAREMAHRLTRIGEHIHAVFDGEMMPVQGLIRHEGECAIGMTLSGTSKEVIDFLQFAKKNGASTVLVTASYVEEQKEFCDEIVLVPSLQRLNQGNLISPQFPILVLIDMLYASLMEMDRSRKRFLHEQTLHIITGS